MTATLQFAAELGIRCKNWSNGRYRSIQLLRLAALEDWMCLRLLSMSAVSGWTNAPSSLIAKALLTAVRPDDGPRGRGPSLPQLLLTAGPERGRCVLEHAANHELLALHFWLGKLQGQRVGLRFKKGREVIETRHVLRCLDPRERVTTPTSDLPNEAISSRGRRRI